jgi:ankyrin repeat protein
LHVAASRGHEAAARALLAQERHRELVDRADKYANKPMHNAAAHGHVNVMNTLAEKGASIVNTPVFAGKPAGPISGFKGFIEPFNLAAEGGHIEAMRWLADRGADINAVDWYGETPLHLAIRGGKTEAIKWLAENGADLDVKLRSSPHRWLNGMTPKEFAIHFRQGEAARLLDELGKKRRPT